MPIFFIFLLSFSLFAEQAARSAIPPTLYEKNLIEPSTIKERELVYFTRNSFENAMKGQSKLLSIAPLVDRGQMIQLNRGFLGQPFNHLLNNLCSLPGVAHLHTGIEWGPSFVAALYGNEASLAEVIGIDLNSNRVVEGRCRMYLGKNQYKIINKDCFSIDLSIFQRPIDVYLYDAGHLIEDQKAAFTYYNNVFADVFIAIVDDWASEDVRIGTFQAFDELHYAIFYQETIPNSDTFGNGQYLAVIKPQRP